METCSRWLSLLFAIIAACAPGSNKDATREAPAAILERLISDPDHLLKPSRADRQRLAEMRSNPRPYLTSLSARFATPPTADDPVAARLFFEELTAAAYIVRQFRTPEGTRLLAQWVAMVDAAGDASPDPATSNVIHLARASLLIALGTSCPDEVSARVRARLPTLDRPGLISATNYLLLACRGRPGLREHLLRLHDDPTSSLHGHPDLARVLEVLQRAP
jgi:hypothetical protein